MFRLRTILASLAELAPLAALGVVLTVTVAPAHAQSGMRSGYQPSAPTTDAAPELEGVTIREDTLDAQLPLDATFVDDTGRTVTFRDVLPKDRPVVLQLGYLKCPMLCSLVMNALVRGLTDLDWSVGNQFDVVSISINPNEKSDLAAGKKLGYVAEYARPGSAAGWHFLTGDEANIRKIAHAVGFEYRLQPNGEYSHAAAVFLITPDGRLSRILYGVKYPSADLRMGLLEASEGRIGSTLDRFILWCHIYDPNAGGYVVMAMRVMQIGGALTLLLLGGGLGWFWWRDLRAKRLAPLSAHAEHAGGPAQ